MGIKNVMEMNKVSIFKRWMEEKNWKSAPVQNEGEVLRLTKSYEKPIVLYNSLGSMYASAEERLFPLITKFNNRFIGSGVFNDVWGFRGKFQVSTKA